MNTINKDNAIIAMIDVQEKLINMLEDTDVHDSAVKLAKAAEILNIPVIITEQYPKGLGSTIEEIKATLSNAVYIEKTFFSAYKENSFKEALEKSGKKQVVILGIETHICVLQTAVELMNNGYEVFVLQEGCGSRAQRDRYIALQRLRHMGCQVVTLEMILFELLEGSKNPKFKEVQALIK